MAAVRLYHHLKECGFELRFSGDDLRIASANQLTEYGRELKAFVSSLTNDDQLIYSQFDHAKSPNRVE